MTNKKYTFVEFIAASESEDFDNIETDNLTWAISFINDYNSIWKNGFHFGDCTDDAVPCTLCVFETYLISYKLYYFNEANWRKRNL